MYTKDHIRKAIEEVGINRDYFEKMLTTLKASLTQEEQFLDSMARCIAFQGKAKYVKQAEQSIKETREMITSLEELLQSCC